MQKKQYFLLSLSVFCLIIGFALMTMPEIEDPTVFNTDEVFSFRRTKLAPFIVLMAYVLIALTIFSIKKTDRKIDGEK